MLKDIKIVDNSDKEIKPKNDLVVLPFKGNNEYITYDEAKNLMRILQGQILSIEVNQHDRRASNSEHKKYNNG